MLVAVQPVKPNLVARTLDQATAMFRTDDDSGLFLIVMAAEHAFTPNGKAIRLAPISNQILQHCATTSRASRHGRPQIGMLIHGWLLAIGRSSFGRQSRVPAQTNGTATMLVAGLSTVTTEGSCTHLTRDLAGRAVVNQHRRTAVRTISCNE